jgi:hypothetical protein
MGRPTRIRLRRVRRIGDSVRHERASPLRCLRRLLGTTSERLVKILPRTSFSRIATVTALPVVNAV